MWENDSPEPTTASRGTFPQVSTRQDAAGRNGDRSVIGSSITIKGEVSGTQDVVIKGRVEGQLSLTGCSLTVGKEGRIKADLLARVIQVDGFVDGLVRGEERILLSETGHVRGKLIAPQIVLEEGCNFKGTVDMGERTQDSAEYPDRRLGLTAHPLCQSPDRKTLSDPTHLGDRHFRPVICFPVSLVDSFAPVW